MCSSGICNLLSSLLLLPWNLLPFVSIRLESADEFLANNATWILKIIQRPAGTVVNLIFMLFYVLCYDVLQPHWKELTQAFFDLDTKLNVSIFISLYPLPIKGLPTETNTAGYLLDIGILRNNNCSQGIICLCWMSHSEQAQPHDLFRTRVQWYFRWEKHILIRKWPLKSFSVDQFFCCSCVTSFQETKRVSCQPG